MWKVVGASVCGHSHRDSGLPCQDCEHYAPLAAGVDSYLIVACSDGAGSAALSEEGSRLACQTFVTAASDMLQCERTLGQIHEAGEHLDLLESVHRTIMAHATEKGQEPRQFACTLLGAIVGMEGGLFLQIGDGAIVTSDGAACSPVFWPQNGEYANTTNFVTDPEYRELAQCQLISQRINELALFTDGLQQLALNFAARQAHTPFFHPMFSALRAAEDGCSLHVPLLQFLDSPAVNERTDDDKTLVLATRIPPHAGATASV